MHFDLLRILLDVFFVHFELNESTDKCLEINKMEFLDIFAILGGILLSFYYMLENLVR